MTRKRKGTGKRTISPEHLAKMQEGRKRAQEERARIKERTELLTDLDARLAEGRRNAAKPVMLPKSRRKHNYARQ